MQIKIKNINHEEKISQRSGKHFTSCRITSVGKDGKDIILSGFGNEITKTWEVGDIVDIELKQTDKGYWNFEMNENSKPSPDKKLALLLEINSKLDKLLGVGKNEVTDDELKSYGL